MIVYSALIRFQNVRSIGAIPGAVIGAALPAFMLKAYDGYDLHRRIISFDRNEQGNYQFKQKTDVEQNKEALTWGTAGIAGCTALVSMGASSVFPKTDGKIIAAGSAAACAATYGALVASLEHAKQNK